MLTLRLLALCALMGAPATASSPIANLICAPRDEMVQRLSGTYGESPMGMGVRDVDTVMEVWATPGSGDWTLVLTYASGNSCIVAMGEDWTEITPAEDPA